MAGLDPAIHDFRAASEAVDARDEPGHDGVNGCSDAGQHSPVLAQRRDPIKIRLSAGGDRGKRVDPRAEAGLHHFSTNRH